jgi:hypothetical protein
VRVARECSGSLLPPSPPAEQATTCHYEARKSGTCDGARHTRGDNFLPYTEADVIDSKASGFGADQVKEQTTYQGGVVVRHQAEELDACLIIRDSADRVAIDIISGDARTGDGIKKAAIESNASLRSAKLYGDRTVECWRAGEYRRSGVCPIVRGKSNRRSPANR